MNGLHTAFEFLGHGMAGCDCDCDAAAASTMLCDVMLCYVMLRDAP